MALQGSSAPDAADLPSTSSMTDTSSSAAARRPSASSSTPMPPSEPLELSNLQLQHPAPPTTPPSETQQTDSSTAAHLSNSVPDPAATPIPATTHTSSQVPPPAPSLDPLAKPSADSSAVHTATAGTMPGTAASAQPSTPPTNAQLPPPAQSMHEHEHNQTDSPILPAADNDAPITSPPTTSDVNDYVAFVLLLPSTGARHPFQIDAKYLQRRGIGVNSKSETLSSLDGTEQPVSVGDANDTIGSTAVRPWDISVYQVKELIWRDWRQEWEVRPSNPAGIRLIHFGRLLDDKAVLKDCRLTPGISNVVHMSIKPQNLDEEDAGADKIRSVVARRNRRPSAGEEEVRRSGCACCCVQ